MGEVPGCFKYTHCRVKSDHMKFNAVLGLSVLLAGSCLQSALADDGLSEDQLRRCISYYEATEEYAGNLERLEEVMNEAEGYIDSYDRKLDRLEGEISTTIGSKRVSLISQYRAMEADQNKFIDAYNFALDKYRLRAKQYTAEYERLEERCFDRSVSSSVLDDVCRGSREGFCGAFR